MNSCRECDMLSRLDMDHGTRKMRGGLVWELATGAAINVYDTGSFTV